MRYFKYLALLAVLAFPAMYSQAQVAVGVEIGPNYGLYNAPPVCEFGYYPYYPYDCAPYGYWGPQWFVEGVFIGAGPWYHFYYLHPAYWGRFYAFGRFHGERGFRSFDRGFRGGHDFHGERGFRADNRGFNGGERGFRGSERAFNGGGRGIARGGGGGGRSFNGGARDFHGGGGGSHGGNGGHGNNGGHGGGHSGRR